MTAFRRGATALAPPTDSSGDAPPSPIRRDIPVVWLLPLIFGGIVVLAVLPVMIGGYLGARDNTSRLLRDQAELMVAATVDHVEQQLRPAQAQASFIAKAVRDGVVDASDAGEMRAFVMGALAATPDIKGIGIVRPDGTMRRFGRADAAVSEEPPERVAAPGDFEGLDVGNGEPIWGPPRWSPILRQPMVRLAVPLQHPGGFAGTLVAAVGSVDLSRHFQQLGRHLGATPFILYDGHWVLAHPALDLAAASVDPAAEVPLPRIETFVDPVLAGIWSRERNPLDQLAPLIKARGHWSWVGERSYAFVYREMNAFGGRPWTVGVYYAGTETARARWIVRGIAIAGLLLLSVSVVVAILVARRLGRPAQRLAAVAGQVAALDLAGIRNLPRGRIREINEASAAFERMAAGLRWFETYVPRTLVRRLIASGESGLTSEEREVTVMFTDLQGFTTLARAISPVASAAYLNLLLARIGPLIEASGGTIDKYTGDGVMAFWGAPEARESHPRDACAAALAMADAVTAFNRARRGAGEGACPMRIGIHTGNVVVGNIGFAGKVDYTIIGSAANTAQRLEQAGRSCIADAEVAILVSDATRAAAGLGFIFADVPEDCVVAGEPVRAWHLRTVLLTGDAIAS